MSNRDELGLGQRGGFGAAFEMEQIPHGFPEVKDAGASPFFP